MNAEEDSDEVAASTEDESAAALDLPEVDGEPLESAGDIASVVDLLTALRESFTPAEPIWFRGHEDASWQLLPSLARAPRSIDAELTVMKRFKQNAFMFLPRSPVAEWEWLFLMQHYRAPTRLLDWTESPLTGLFFAAAFDCDEDRDGCLWALSPTRLNEIARIQPEFAQDIPCFGEDEELDAYMPSRIHKRPSVQTNTPVAAIAPRQFERIYAQLGVFTITQKDQVPLEALADGRHLKFYSVPRDAKPTIREELSYLRVTRLTVFPELQNVADAAVEGLWT